MFIATLIAAGRLGSGDISAAEDALAGAGRPLMGRSWIEADVACDILFAGGPAAAREVLEGLIPGVDVVVQGEAARRRKLLVADMDSTMITVECIDELAEFAGVRSEVEAVTERAMQGELDFASALRARVALLGGLGEEVILRCLEEKVRITPGAIPLVRTMRRDGAYCLLVSGGFSAFADPVAREIGFHAARSNRLQLSDGHLTGTVDEPILGAEAKRHALADAAAERSVDLADTMAIGDGANDIPMIEAAGLGVAYHAKPKLAEVASARIDHGDLGALLYAQGYARSEWALD